MATRTIDGKDLGPIMPLAVGGIPYREAARQIARSLGVPLRLCAPEVMTRRERMAERRRLMPWWRRLAEPRRARG